MPRGESKIKKKPEVVWGQGTLAKPWDQNMVPYHSKLGSKKYRHDAVTMNVNRCVLMGQLRTDPEILHFAIDEDTVNAVLCINLRVDNYLERVKDMTEEEIKAGKPRYINHPLFVEVYETGRRAEFLSQYLRKGETVLVEGQLRTMFAKDPDMYAAHEKPMGKLFIKPRTIELIDNRTFDRINAAKRRRQQQNDRQS